MTNGDLQKVVVIDETIAYDRYIPIDLSAANADLAEIQLDDAEEFGHYIDGYISKHGALAAYGGYNEVRNLYRTSSIFKEDSEPERNIHIGMDIWAPSGTAVLAALDGKIHSFNNNVGKGNYGPTIILQHKSENRIFNTLYGHLSLDSLEDSIVGQEISQGQFLGSLGDAIVNGGYPPHLHFQIINNIESYSGDYPGVCSADTRSYFLENCPNPNLLLNITNS